jgi:hypothetical protein
MARDIRVPGKFVNVCYLGLTLTPEIFADRVSFVGVAGERHRARIVTRQPHIRGEDATPDEIVFLMTAELGFRLLPERFSVGYADSLAFARENVERRQRPKLWSCQ